MLVAIRCPGCGKVAVLLRDKKVATVDLSAPKTRNRQIVAFDSWRRKQTGRVRIALSVSPAPRTRRAGEMSRWSPRSVPDR